MPVVRILGDHRYEITDAQQAALSDLDDNLTAAMDSGDESLFEAKLSELISWVRSVGSQLDVDDFRTSDLVIPYEGATSDEVRTLLDSDEAVL